jgi:hypothetical protein
MRETFELTPGLAELVAFSNTVSHPLTEYDRQAFEALLRCLSPEFSESERAVARRISSELFQVN